MKKEKLRKGIKKFDLEKGEVEELQFGLHDFDSLKNADLCLTQEPHNHSFYQIIYFKNTEAKHYIDFEEFDIKPDSLIFVAKNQVHCFEQNMKYHGLLVHFSESFLISNDSDINFFLTYHIFNNKDKPYFKVPETLISKINNYFDQIESELNNTNEFGNSAILSNLLKSLLLVVEREMRKDLSEKGLGKAPNPAYLNFLNLLEKNFKTGWSVAAYADASNTSTKTLNSIIKKETGLTVSQLITDRIILEAKRQLTHTNLFINQIAFDLGFRDPYYFIKYFKKHVNCTPKEFRITASRFY